MGHSQRKKIPGVERRMTDGAMMTFSKVQKGKPCATPLQDRVNVI